MIKHEFPNIHIQMPFWEIRVYQLAVIVCCLYSVMAIARSVLFEEVRHSLSFSFLAIFTVIDLRQYFTFFTCCNDKKRYMRKINMNLKIINGVHQHKRSLGMFVY